MEHVFRQALAHQNAGRWEEAEALYRQVEGFRPEWTLGNLGAILRTTGRLAEAEAVLREGLKADPQNASIRHSLGMTLLQLGRYAEAWPLYEDRLQLYPRPHPNLPEWRGEPLAGRRIAVVAEQGFGDQILFSRFLPVLAERAAKVIAVAPRSLRRLFAALPVEVWDETMGWDQLDADLWTFAGAAPRWLGGLGPDDGAAPFHAPPGGDGLGLMLGGSPRNPNPLRLPPPAVAKALRGLADFVDLSPEATGAADLKATAEIIARLALVVTTDTSVAHLAGSLGKPVWVMLPRPAADWYSRWDRDGSAWYPAMRTFRQAAPNDWASVLVRVAEALEERHTSKSRPTSP